LHVAACGEGRLWVEVWQGVHLGRYHIAKLTVYGPYMESLGNLLVAAGGVAAMGVEAAARLVSLGEIAFVVQLVVDLGRGGEGREEEKEEWKQNNNPLTAGTNAMYVRCCKDSRTYTW